MELNKIYLGDNIKLIGEMPDNFINLTISSPPYDSMRTYEKTIQNNTDYNGYSFDFETLATELYRTTVPGGVVVWVVGDMIVDGGESGNSFRQALFFKGCGFNIFDTMIYQKASLAFADPIRYTQSFEYMFVFSKGKPNTINLLQKKNKWAGTSNWGKKTDRHKDGSMIHKKQVTVAEYGNRTNIWKIKQDKRNSSPDNIQYHPATFPEQIPMDHIKSWTVEGDVIFDPFSGSGTTCKMAMILNRKYVGFELIEKYHKLSIERLEKHKNTLHEFFG